MEIKNGCMSGICSIPTKSTNKKTGSGQLFVLYEVDDDGCDLDRSYINTSPDDDGLSRYGGRL